MGWFLLAGGIALLDLLIKNYIVRHKSVNCYEPVLGGKIVITRFHNRGAAFGWMKGKSKELVGLSLFMLGAIAGGLAGTLHSKQSLLIKIGLAMMLGGASSNIYDRIRHQEVTDYFRISIGSKHLERIIFNLGDIAIFIGAVVSCIGELKDK